MYSQPLPQTTFIDVTDATTDATRGVAVRRTISRRIDVLLLKTPAGTHILATGTAQGARIPTAIRAVVCSVSIKWIWREKSKQCAWLASNAAVKRQPGEAPA